MKKTLIFLLLVFMFSGGNQNAEGQEGISIQSGEPSLDIVNSGLKDRNGNLWFATSKRGVYRYDGTSFVRFAEKDGLTNTCVNCICEDKSGMLWFGTSNGVFTSDGKKFKNFPLPLMDSSSERSRHYSRWPKQVQNMLQDRRGNFWFVTEQHGVYRYDPSARSKQKPLVTPGTGDKAFTTFLPEETLQCIAEDKDGSILVGSWQGGGVYRLDPSTGTKSFKHLTGFSDGMIYCMLTDKWGTVWVGTRAHGLDRYDGKTITNFSEKDGLSNNVHCMMEDTKGNLWFGSNFNKNTGKRGDAFCFDGKSFRNVTEKERSLTLTDYNVWSMVEDNAGNIWLGSRDGRLLRYNPSVAFIQTKEGPVPGRGSFTDFSEEISK